jgi:hypothetical protein
MKLEPGLEQSIGMLALVELEANFLELLGEPPFASIAAKLIGDQVAIAACVAVFLAAATLTREQLGLPITDISGPPIH